jgi:WD40 repeat protein
VAAAGNSIRLYDTTTFEERLRIERKQARGVHFTDEGKTLTAAVDGAVYRWDAVTGKSLIPEAADSVVEQILVSADGSRVVTRGQAGDGHLWDGTTGKHLRRLRVAWQRGLAMSPDGRFLAWPVEDESVRFSVPQDPRSIYSGSRIRLYDIVADSFVDRFAGFKGAAEDLAFTGDGKKIVTIDSRPGMVRIWNRETGKEERGFEVAVDALKKQSYFVGRTQLSPDGRTAVVTYVEDRGGRLGRGPHHLVRLWDVATGKERAPLNGAHPLDKAFSPDGRLVATNGGNHVRMYSPDGRLIGPTDGNAVCETAGGTRVAALPPVYIHAAAFSRDGRFLATAVEEGAIQLWEVATWTKLKEFKGHRDPPTALAFMPNGQLLSGSIDTTVLAWATRPSRVAGSVTLEKAWNDLAKRDAAESFQSEGRFLATPADAVKFFAERIKPVEALDPRRVEQLLADLGRNEFAVREAASKALAGLDEQATPYLEATLHSTDSAEVRVRVTRLLEQRRGAAITAEGVRQIRAVMVLERIGDGEAKDLLKRWAGGPVGARLTTEAAAALKRLEAVRM